MNRANNVLNRAVRIACISVILLLTVNVHADATSDYELGKRAFHDDDLIAAMQYLERAAQREHVEAMLLLGYILDQAEENATALDYYRRASDLGSAEAAMALGSMYASGDGVEKSNEQALGWYQKAAERGSGVAMTKLGQAYIQGDLGLRADPDRGYELLERAAAGGHEPARRLLEQETGKQAN